MTNRIRQVTKHVRIRCALEYELHLLCVLPLVSDQPSIHLLYECFDTCSKDREGIRVLIYNKYILPHLCQLYEVGMVIIMVPISVIDIRTVSSGINGQLQPLLCTVIVCNIIVTRTIVITRSTTVETA